MSGSVFLTNLDDFIAPSQACINPLVAAGRKDINSHEKNDSTKVNLALDLSTSDFDAPPAMPSVIKSAGGSDNKKVATVSLNDCLACRYLT